MVKTIKSSMSQARKKMLEQIKNKEKAELIVKDIKKNQKLKERKLLKRNIKNLENQ